MTQRLRSKANLGASHRGTFVVYLGVGLAVFLGLQISMYLTTLDRTVGKAGLFAAGGPLGAKHALNVAILRSDATAKLNPQHPEYYFDLASEWANTLSDQEVKRRFISDQDLTSGLSEAYNVLVLPEATCLNDTQRQNIRRFVESGHGVVASGGLGSRSSDCTWKGYQYLEEFTGMKQVTGGQSEPETYAVFRGNRFHSAHVPAGAKLEAGRQELVSGTALSGDVYLGDARLRPVGGNPAQGVLATHGSRGKGRFVWFGFRETMPAGDRSEREHLRSYLAIAVQWAGRQPLSSVGTWPRHYTSAAMILANVEDEEGGISTASALQAANVPGTFSVSSKLASSSKVLMKKLNAAGEIVSTAEMTETFDNAGVERQSEFFRTAKAPLEANATFKVVGFNPSEGASALKTVPALNNAAYSYYVDRSGAPRSVPETVNVSTPSLFRRPEQLARFSALAANDIEVIADYKGPTPWRTDLADGFLTDFHSSQELGGLYTLDFRTDLLGAPENKPILSSLLSKISAEPVWIATGRELAQWWLERENLRVQSEFVTSDRIRLAVTNRGTKPVEHACVYVYLPRKPKSMRMISSTLGDRLPRTEMMDGTEILRIDLAKLPAQASSIWLLALDEEQ